MPTALVESSSDGDYHRFINKEGCKPIFCYGWEHDFQDEMKGKIISFLYDKMVDAFANREDDKAKFLRDLADEISKIDAIENRRPNSVTLSSKFIGELIEFKEKASELLWK